jgi:hypothetical protein
MRQFPNNSDDVLPEPSGDRLDSWKEIAAYLQRDVTTVRRWERKEGLPVHRKLHEKLGTVYAFRAELDAWWDHGRQTGARAAVPASSLRRRRASGLIAWRFLGPAQPSASAIDSMAVLPTDVALEYASPFQLRLFYHFEIPVTQPPSPPRLGAADRSENKR